MFTFFEKKMCISDFNTGILNLKCGECWNDIEEGIHWNWNFGHFSLVSELFFLNLSNDRWFVVIINYQIFVNSQSVSQHCPSVSWWKTSQSNDFVSFKRLDDIAFVTRVSSHKNSSELQLGPDRYWDEGVMYPDDWWWKILYSSSIAAM